MPSPEAIGGFFELELPCVVQRFEPGVVLLNSARSAFEYVLLAAQPSLVHLPKFTCDVMLEPLQRTGTRYAFYEINDSLEVAGEVSLRSGEMLVYTNYFGIKDAYCNVLAARLGSQLVLDCSQALFYAVPPQVHGIYSPRKFVGVPDGGLLVSPLRLAGELPRDTSADRFDHLVARLDVGPEAAYARFKANDAALSRAGMMRMPASTERLLGAIDLAQVRAARRRNFLALHEALGPANGLTVDPASADGPMVYPFRSASPGLRERLGDERVFVATYWPNVFTWCSEDEVEWRLAAELLPLPIDQRYGSAEMVRIIQLLS
jgi:hypothetical protein